MKGDNEEEEIKLKGDIALLWFHRETLYHDTLVHHRLGYQTGPRLLLGRYDRKTYNVRVDRPGDDFECRRSVSGSGETIQTNMG